MSIRFNTVITLDLDIELEVEAQINKAVKGKYWGDPSDCYPDEGATIDGLISVRINNIEILPSLGRKQIGLIEEEVLERYCDKVDSQPDFFEYDGEL